MWKQTATLGLLSFAVATGVTPLIFDRAIAWAEAAARPAFEIVVITGRIEPAEENFLGRAAQIQIVSAEAGAFLIAHEGKGRELKHHVGAIVTLTAERMHDAEGNEILSVERYRVHRG